MRRTHGQRSAPPSPLQGGVFHRLRLALAGLAAAAFAAPAVAQDGDPTLADAARDRDVETVRTLIDNGGDLDAFGSDGTPALHWIVRMQDVETAALLIEAGADPSQENRYGLTPLQQALEFDDADMIALLLQAGADPGALDTAGEPMLFTAVRNGAPNIVRALLDAGAEADALDPTYSQSALMVAAREGQAEIVAMLIDAGADVNRQTPAGPEPRTRLPAENTGSKGEGIVRGGWPEHGMRAPISGAKTPLIYAAREDAVDVARLLLDAGADIEQADANGSTPLIVALVNDAMDVAQLLIETGADVNASDWYGQTPLWAAVDMRNLDVPGPTRDNGVDRERALEVIRLLISHGADVNARTTEYPPERRFIVGLGSLSWVDFTGQTPFLRAALSGDVTVMRLLVDNGADPNIATYAGTTPLMAAAGVNWVVSQTYDEGPEALLEAVRLCWELGNDVNAVNSMGVRAVHGAANRGSDEILRLLVEKGARLDVADNVGRTTMTWAEGVFLATHAPEPKPSTIALITELSGQTQSGGASEGE